MRDTPRRSFLKSSLAASAAPLFIPASVLFGSNRPSNRLTLGFIGVGGHGTNYNLKHFLSQEDCRAVSVCDAYQDRMERASQLVNETYGDEGCRMISDFREILADRSVDAVVISTPDHWHIPMSLLALEAGKHVFCEKPTYRIGEGRDLIDLVNKTGLTFSTGLEDRSMIKYHKLVEWERNGAIGELFHAEVTLPPGTIQPADDPAPVPDGLNWEMWLGPAPFREYTPTTTGWLNWRYIRDFSTGVLTDWGTHLCDTGQLAINDPYGCAVSCKAWGQPVPAGSQSDIPAIYEVHYTYSNGKTMSVKNSEGAEWMGQKASIRLLGTKGWVAVNGWNGTFAASDRAILRERYEPDQSKHWSLPKGEHRNFLDSIKASKKPTYPADTLHELSTTLHMGLMAMDLGRAVLFDPVDEVFINDSEANQFLRRGSMREAWKST